MTMLNPFAMLRALARNAVMDGIADAVTEAAPADGTAPPDLAALRERIASRPAPAALPAAPTIAPTAEVADPEPDAAEVPAKPARKPRG